MTNTPVEKTRKQLIEPLTTEQIERAINLLDSWCEVDEAQVQEQRETWEYLKKVLDEDRLSDRKLFP